MVAQSSRRADRLSARQQAFVLEYMIDHNATRAAIAAGYSEKSARSMGSQLLTNLNVQAALRRHQRRAVERTEVTLDRVIAEYTRIAFADIRNLVIWGALGIRLDPSTGGQVAANGVGLVDSTAISDADAAAISEISQGPNGALRIKLHSKTAALDSLARLLGMMGEKDQRGPVDHNGRREDSGDEIDVRYCTSDELREMRRILLAAAARKAADVSGAVPSAMH